jgi:glycosyltransferase involved in cell wall biosynthesis
VRDDAEAFADAVRDVLADAGLRRRLGEQARRTVVERYDWEVVGRPMLDAYRRLLEGAREMSPC